MDHSYALQIVRNNGNRITMVPAELINEEIRAAAITRTPTAIEHIQDPTLDEQNLAIRGQGEIDREGIFELVSMIQNIDTKVLDTTLDINGNCISLIEAPTIEQLKRAVTRDGDAIKHIQDPDHALQVIAVRHNHSNAQFIEQPTHELVDIMLAANPRSVEWIKHPHRDHQQYVLQRLPDDGIHYLQELDEDIALKHITENPTQIELMTNQTEECCWAALTADGGYIKYIRNPTPEMESYAKLVSDGS